MNHEGANQEVGSLVTRPGGEGFEVGPACLAAFAGG